MVARPLVFALLCAGCAASQEPLRGPLDARCGRSGLHECPEMTQAILAYTGGARTEGWQRVQRVAASSGPEELRSFAASLHELGRKLGTDGYESLFEVADALQAQASQRIHGDSPRALLDGSSAAIESSRLPDPRPPLPDTRHQVTADTDPARIEGGTQILQADVSKVPCGGSAAGLTGVCIKVVDGPIVVTDLQVTCEKSAFVLASRLSLARWSLPSTSYEPLAVHGARLLVKADESLLFGATANGEHKKGKPAESRCALTWSGFRAYPGPRESNGTDIGY